MIADRVAGLARNLAPEVAPTLALALNHLLHAEPVAAQRLVRHAGRRIELRFGDGGFLGSAVPLRFEVTPAGLLDSDCTTGDVGSDFAADVVITLRREPLAAVSALLSGAPPPVDLDGQTELAAEVRWLLDNVRWDFEGDLERLIGPTAAHAGVRVGASLAAAARGALDTVASMRSRGPGR